MPSVFTVLRAITALFRTDQDANLGLYGAFGYDLAFQFDPVDYRLERAREPARPRALPARRDPGRRPLFGQGLARPLRLFGQRLLDRGPAARRRGRAVQAVRPHPAARRPRARRICPARRRRRRRASGAATCSRSCPGRCSTSAARPQPSEISRRLKAINPSPYSFFINLGEGEYLIGASPEMFVRVNGRRVETCPISGTIKRGDDAISDSRADPEAAQFEEGRIRADHVLGRRPQRQVAGSASRARCASSAAARSRCIRA